MKNTASKLTYLLAVGLALTFLANCIGAYLNPDDFRQTISDSAIFGKILDFAPWFPWIIVADDLFVALWLLSGKFRRLAGAWATLWLLGVITVIATHMNTEGSLDALEHGAPLAIALFLAFSKTEEPVSASAAPPPTQNLGIPPSVVESAVPNQPQI